ncbi:MAG TPA: alcohol dehydrogenase catalytic domain-containing protein [Chthonomonadaceae bacterium]|nr:alcohol dehydrogenase catalytic domain-containing protein [Chthonomonadaceae bacterium]
MRAAVYRGIDDVRVESVDVPALCDGEVLVRVEACGVCGTDLKKIHYGLVQPPRIFGHETAGTIVQVGAGVRDWAVGDRVAVNHHVPCRKPDCFFCSRDAFAQCPVYKRTGATAGFEPAGGGFAEFVRVLEWCVGGMVRLPPRFPADEASMIEPLNTCLKGVRMAGLRAGDTAVVFGQGPIGMLFTQLARIEGATVIAVDKIESRRRTALSLGAAEALDPAEDVVEAAFRASDGRGADLAIVAVPSTEVASAAFQFVRPAGKVLLFAQTRLGDSMEVDAGAVCMQEKALMGSYSSDIRLQDEAASLIFTRRVDVRPLLTHRLPLEGIADAIDLAARPREGSLKVIVAPQA